MASPPHSNSAPDVDPDQFSDPPTDRNGAPISSNERSSTHSSSSSTSSSSASRKIPPVPKFLPENSSIGASPKEESREGASSPSSSAFLQRKLPPVPKFTSNNAFPMGPPPPKSSASSRGVMGPPPVPKFESSSGEKKSLGPPPVPKFLSSSGEKQALGVPQVSSDSPQPSTDVPSERLEKSFSEEERPGATAALRIAEGGDGANLQGNGVSAVEETGRMSLAETGNRKEPRSADTSSGAASSGQPPYVKPSWSAEPGQPYTMEILKEGNILGLVDVSKKGAYMFGRSERCDFLLEHPTVSRYHAVLQYNSEGESFLYDLGSTHGTFINKLQVKGREYVPLHVGDIVRFGFSSRLHVFQGPLDLMPEEGLSKKERQERRLLESAQDRAIREASLIRGKREAIAADGISWGMQEDAEEEAEENVEEVTWQTFKGELTEKQQKTLGKIHKYNEKLSNLRKENDAIQAKEISQGGLTQGQQTQVARNEQRMEQLVEEVENLEETVNESIQESISGRTGVRRGKNNRFDEEDEDDLSDDEFYDRASKGQARKKKEVVQKVETADSLLDQKAALTREIENLREAIKAKDKTPTSSQEADVGKGEADTADPLDQFMTHLSSTILKDTASHLQKELDSLRKDLERVERLLKLADPTGEGLKKWELKKSATGIQESNRIYPRKEDAKELATPVANVTHESDQVVLQEAMVDAAGELLKSDENADKSADSETDTVVLPGLEPALRLGAPMPKAVEEAMPEVSTEVHEEAASFITYKERKKGIDSRPQAKAAEVVVEGEGQELSEKKEDNVSVVDLRVADSVALLLRQKRGLVEDDSDPVPIANVEEKPQSKRSSKKRKKQGPAVLPPSIDMDPSEGWVPPAGQTGDGRTSLNDKYGY